MIVNYTPEGWEIVTQRAHGLLAAGIAHEWKHSLRTSRWVETLIAIAEHDDAQIELERDDLLTPQGGPSDFKMRKMDFEHCKQTLDFAYSKSTYIALLCSMHLSFLCNGANSDQKLKKMLAEMQENRLKWLKQLNLSEEEASADYRLLEWCDALSLLICQHDDQPEKRSVEISTGPDNRSYFLHQLEPEVLTVEPWPFEEPQFELNYEYRILEKLQFKDAVEFRKHFLSSDPKCRTWIFRKPA